MKSLKQAYINKLNSTKKINSINNNIINNYNKISIQNNSNNSNKIILRTNNVNISNASNKFLNGKDNYLRNKNSHETINKIFKTNLVKERESSKKNYLINILSNFQGRVTRYNGASEGDYCTDADELFEEFLIDENEIREKEMKERRIKENKEMEKIMIIKSFEDNIQKQKEERTKIEKELSIIDERNKKEIIEKEQENKILKQKLEDLEKKVEENKKEREKEKKKIIRTNRKKYK